MSADIESLPEKIKKGPYWRVNFRPFSHKRNAGEETQITFDLVHQVQIRLRGWPYPFISDDRLEQIRNPKYIASGKEYRGHIEYWRLYYSTQFINIFTIREKTNQNWDLKLREQATQWMLMPEQLKSSDIPGFVDIINLLYHLTEIFELASRFCGIRLYNEDLEISIQLHNIKGFGLIAEYPRVWDEYYPATSDSVLKKSIFRTEQLLARSADFALEWAFYFYNQFGWDNPSLEILKGDQQKFLSGRL